MADTNTSARLAHSVLSHGTVEVRVADSVKLETLHSVIDQIARISGCLACGLLGIDLVFRGGDPAEFNNIKTLPGITGVGFGH